MTFRDAVPGALTALIGAIALLSCAEPPAAPREIASPAPDGSAQPSLVVSPGGRVYVSWVEPVGDSAHALKFSALEDSTWSEPRLIAAGPDWFVNWADFPTLAVSEDETSMTAHWLEKSGPDTYAYGVRISRSSDGGRTWSAPLTPHRDSTQTEHGFVSLWPRAGGSVGAIWLDGREMAGGGDGHGSGVGHGEASGHGTGNMTLRTAAISPEGGLSEEAVLDDKVCECCQTSVAVGSAGPVAVYRDNADGIRDIAIVRWKDASWTAPVPIFNDRWVIDGCPVNGPAVDARGEKVAVAWFTAPNDSPRVKLAFSTDGGATFDKPIMVDDGHPGGRVDVVILDDGCAAVSWLEWVGEAGAVRVRHISPDGVCDPGVDIAPIAVSRSSGFPRMVRRGNELVFAWTGERVRTAILQVQ